MSIDNDPWLNHGGPAFPAQANREHYRGMTLRDWFAGQAMSGYCINAETSMQEFRDIARDAYQQADAMLAERAK